MSTALIVFILDVDGKRVFIPRCRVPDRLLIKSHLKPPLTRYVSGPALPVRLLSGIKETTVMLAHNMKLALTVLERRPLKTLRGQLAGGHDTTIGDDADELQPLNE